MNRLVEIITSTILIMIAIFMLIKWQNHQDDIVVAFSKPGMDNAPTDRGKVSNEIKIGEFFNEFKKYEPTGLTGKWVGFRGVDSDNICKDGIKLADKWSENGPKVLWRKTLGEGHAGAAIYDGYVYVLDYLEEEEADALRCFSLMNGTELWRRWYKIPVKRNHGKSRTVPAVNENYVVTIGPKCQVMCVRRQTGELLWTIDLLNDFGGKLPQWYTGQCPLIDGDKVILAPSGGNALLVAVDLETGKTVWQTPNNDKFEMSHASVIPMTIADTKMYVYAALGGTAGVSVDGTLLWSSSSFKPSVLAPSPVPIGKDRIYLTAGYGAGSSVIQIKKSENKFVVETLGTYKPKEAMALEQQSAIFWKNHLLGILPKDAGANRQQLVACKPDDTTKFTSLSGRDKRFGLGPFIVADDKIYVLSDNGVLSMFSFENSQFKLLSEHKVLTGHDAWAPLAIADGKMVLRDSTEMICIDLTTGE